MLKWILTGLWELLSQLGEWFLDLFRWGLEWVFEIANMFFQWSIDFALDNLEEAIDMIAPYIPSGLSSVIGEVLSYLAFIDPWFPVSFGLSLFTAYYVIKFGLLKLKWIVKLVPGLGR